MTTNDLADIAKKIAAIEALAQGGATAGEVAAATAALSRLLTKYNITIERARAIADASAPREAGITSEQYKTGAGKRFAWENDLFVEIARAYYCRPMYTLDNRDYQFIGRPNDAQTAMRIFDRVRNVISALATADVTAYADWIKANTLVSPKELKGSQSLRARRLSFCEGAVSEISIRLHEARRADDAEYSGEVTALVVKTDAAIDAFLADWTIGPPPKYNAATRNEAAYAKGREAGKTISLHRADLTD